jgi:hypothetical protein
MAMGSNGGHVILHTRTTAAFGTLVPHYDYRIGANGKVSQRAKLPFQIYSLLALAVGPELQPHLLFYGLNENKVVLEYAAETDGKWATYGVPDPGCGVLGSPQIGSIAVDAADHVYIPCVWQQSAGVNFASLIMFDGSNWSREDVATTRSDNTTHAELLPAGTAFAVADKENAVHLGYSLSDDYYSGIVLPYGPEICESVRHQPGSYTENCYDTGDEYSQIGSMTVGPGGDPHFTYGPRGDYLHFDGTSWTNEALTLQLSNLVVDSNDIPSSAYIDDNEGGGDSVLYYAVLTPSGWQSQPVAEAPRFFFGLQVAMLNPAGLPYIATTAGSGTSPSITEGFYTFVSAPDLSANWNDITLTTKGKPKLIAHLRVLNDGNAAGDGYELTCFLSQSSTVSSADPEVGKATLSLAAGASRVLTFEFDPSKAPSGEYLVAQIVTKPGEANPDNNTAAIMIP